MPNRGRPTTRKSARTRQGPAATAQTPAQTNFRLMATEALRLLLAQYNLTQTGTRQQLIARLEANQEVPNPQSGSDVPVIRTVQDSTLAPQAELAQLIASIIDEKLASQQDGGHLQIPRATTRATPREGHAVEPSLTPFQDGRQQLQDGRQQLQDGRQQQQSLPTPQSAFPALPQPGALFNPSDPVTVAALLPDFRQPSIASHLTKTTTTAITNGQGMPPPSLTCASTLTMADPVPAPHALSSIDATTLDAMPLTQARNTQNSPATEKTALSHLQALAVPPGATPEYLSQLSPPTPINIPKLESYLHDHPNQSFVQYLLSGFSHGFKIGYSGPRAPQEFPNLPSAKENPSIIDKNMLKEVSLGHTAGPFLSPLFQTFKFTPLGLSLRNTPLTGGQSSTSPSRNTTPLVSMPTSHRRIIPSITLK
ncbi:hypothetical protein ACROYT_G015051 [Oculina patagonica]